MELISTTKTYHLHFAYAIGEEEQEYIAIIVHYDGTDMNTIRLSIKDLEGNFVNSEQIEKFVQDRYIDYCIANNISYE